MAIAKESLDKIKKILESEKERLEAELGDLTVKKGKINQTVFPQFGDHAGENASEVASYDNAISVKNTLEKELRDVVSSLKRIKDKSYGTCKYCKKVIGEKRLEIRPTSSACIDCKKKFSGEK
jgi:DnaK suppressor protein